MSSIASAKSFFSLLFSSSSAFSRWASDTSMPPNRALYLKNVAELIPCLRQTSTVGEPLYCSFRIPMICASVNRDCFIVRLLAWADSTKNWRRFRGSGQIECNQATS